MHWQRERFRVHIRRGTTGSQPLIVHTRSASEDTLAVLREEGASEAAGCIPLFHRDDGRRPGALDLGFMVSFSGILTFRNAEDLREVARYVPLERCLIETDSPYLAPVPHRGKTNSPAWVPQVAAKLAEVKQIPLERVAQATSANFARSFCPSQTSIFNFMQHLRFLIYLIVAACFSDAHAGSFDDFFRAVRTDNASGVAALLERGFDPNARDESGQPALSLAVREGSDRVVDVLLRNPQLDLNALNSVGESALMFAALEGRLEVAQRMVEQGATIRQDGGIRCTTQPRGLNQRS